MDIKTDKDGHPGFSAKELIEHITGMFEAESKASDDDSNPIKQIETIINGLAKELMETRSHRDTLIGDMKFKLELIDAARSNSTKLEARIQRMRGRIDEAEARFAEAHRANHELASQLRDAEGRFEGLSRDLEGTMYQLTQLEGERSQLLDANSRLEAELNRLTATEPAGEADLAHRVPEHQPDEVEPDPQLKESDTLRSADEFFPKRGKKTASASES